MIIDGLSPTGALPSVVDQSLNMDRFFVSEGHRSAYMTVFNAERAENDEQKRLNLRVLGFLLLFAPGPDHKAIAEIGRTIKSCESQDLHILGGIYKDCFVKTFYKFKGPNTPQTPAHHPSRPSFDRRLKEIMAEVHEAPENHKQAKEKALVRDGYRCIASRCIDESYQALFSTAELIQSGTARTQLAHIVPESTYFRLNDPDKKNYAASILAVFDRFGVKVTELDGVKVHSLWNAMTLVDAAHDYFDRLELWFEATDIPNQYNIKYINTYSAMLKNYVTNPITLVSNDPLLPLPDPKLLALHAAACKVAHLSGAADYLEEIYRDVEETGVLAEDGGSSVVLTQAILRTGLVHVEG